MSSLSINQSIQEAVTPRASHVDNSSDTETEVDDDSDDEIIDPKVWLDSVVWFKWYKTTDEYKQMNPN